MIIKSNKTKPQAVSQAPHFRNTLPAGSPKSGRRFFFVCFEGEQGGRARGGRGAKTTNWPVGPIRIACVRSAPGGNVILPSRNGIGGTQMKRNAASFRGRGGRHHRFTRCCWTRTVVQAAVVAAATSLIPPGPDFIICQRSYITHAHTHTHTISHTLYLSLSTRLFSFIFSIFNSLAHIFN